MGTMKLMMSDLLMSSSAQMNELKDGLLAFPSGPSVAI